MHLLSTGYLRPTCSRSLRAEVGIAAARPRGGMHAWLPLDAGEDDVAVAERAARAGVLVWAGRRFLPAEPSGPFLRVTFAGEPPERLVAGIRLLAAARKG